MSATNSDSRVLAGSPKAPLIKIQDQCPVRRDFTCGLIDVELGHRLGVPLSTCQACLALGGMVGGESVRKQWVEARLTIEEEAPRSGCGKCAGVRRLYEEYPTQVEKWEQAALSLGMALTPLGLYRNGVMVRVGTLGELCSHLKMALPEANLEGVFDRVVVINLKRRSDRLVKFWAQDVWKEWPFKTPEVFEGIDGSLVPHPKGWTHGNGTWGCMQSHRQVLEKAIQEGADSILVLEDDAGFLPGFAGGVRTFLENVPGDWDGLYLGGQHLDSVAHAPQLAAPGVVKVYNPNRAHAYAVRGQYMRDLYAELCAFSGHCDALMGPFAGKHRVYAPATWLVSQTGGPSDISGANDKERVWDIHRAATTLLLLLTPPGAGYRIRIEQMGGYTGNGQVEHGTGVDKLLWDALAAPNRMERARLIQGWWTRATWDSGAGQKRLHPVMWHPRLKDFIQEIRTALPSVKIFSQEITHLEGVTRDIVANAGNRNPTVDLQPPGRHGEQADGEVGSSSVGPQG